MKSALRYAGLSNKGRVRESNEDNWFADPELGLFIVADGMGGQFAGALAAKAVVTVLPALVRDYLGTMEDLSGSRARRGIERAISTLSLQIRQQTRNEPGLDGMGSTVVCAFARGDRVLVAHMGDSRAYRLRKGGLQQLTEDHTLMQLLLDRGELNPEEVPTHPARGRLTRAVGMPGEPLPQSRLLTLDQCDLLMLCTDGLTGMLSDRQILGILRESAPLEERCRLLIDTANKAGGHDNITALLISFLE